jgi:hypothetical protein
VSEVGGPLRPANSLAAEEKHAEGLAAEAERPPGHVFPLVIENIVNFRWKAFNINIL